MSAARDLDHLALAKPLAPRLPALQERTPHRYAARVRAAEALRAFARRWSITHDEIADCFGVSKSVVSRMLKGEVAIPLEMLFALPRRHAARALNAFAEVAAELPEEHA